MRRLVILVALVLAATACEVRLETNLSIAEDESGTLSLELSLDQELRDLMANQGLGDLAALSQALGDVPEGWTLEDFSDGEFEGLLLSTAFVDADDLTDRIGRLDSLYEQDGFSPGAFTAISVERQDDQFTFEADLTGLEAGVEGLGSIAGPALGGLDPTQVFETIFTTRVVVDLPGAIEDHNADAIEGNTLQWDIGLADSGKTLRATSTTAQSSSLMSFLGLGAIIAGVVIVGALLAGRRNRRREEEFAAARALDATNS